MNALVVGGSSGIGLSIVLELLEMSNLENVYVLDKKPFPSEYVNHKLLFIAYDLTNHAIEDVLAGIGPIQMLYITAGFGHLRHFQDYDEQYIRNSFEVNAIAPILIVRYFYDKMLGEEPFYCAVMVSIAGRLNSPLFSIYSATKSGLSRFIEAINVELEMQGSPNRILEVSPGKIEGTGFYGEASDPNRTKKFAQQIIIKSKKREMLFIPQYDEIYKNVIKRNNEDPHLFGIQSYKYKQDRINKI